MEVSLGFVVVLTLILFPGLIFRRLYFYGEFSKQFNSGLNLISLISISIIPGILILVSVFYLYSSFFAEIDLEEIIDKFKDINSEEYRLTQSKDQSLNKLFSERVFPFIGFLYVFSFLLGILSGRFVRITKLDTKFKLLRFKNYWFYLFNGQHADFKRLRHLKEKNSKHLFTKADILIDSNSKTHLYSGIVVDYELDENDCKTLSKVMLQNAERYSLKDEKRVPVSIPGTLFVVDCSNMININLTFIYEETKNILKSKIPSSVEVVFGLIIILLIPIFIFQTDNITWEVYKIYFLSPWYAKIIIFLTVVQMISLLNPFVKEKEEYYYVNWKSIIAKFIWIGVMFLLLWLII